MNSKALAKGLENISSNQKSGKQLVLQLLLLAQLFPLCSAHAHQILLPTNLHTLPKLGPSGLCTLDLSFFAGAFATSATTNTLSSLSSFFRFAYNLISPPKMFRRYAEVLLSG